VFATTLGNVGTGLAITVGLNAFLAQTAKGNSRDPAVLLTGAMLLGLVSAIASALPAWHASKLAPMTATAQRLRDARAYTLIGVKWAVPR